MAGEQNLWGFTKTPRFDGDPKPMLEREDGEKKNRIRSLKLSLLFRFGKRNGAHRALIGKSKVGFK